VSESDGKEIQASERKCYPEDRAVIKELLNDLRINDRQALLRFYVDGQPLEELVSACGLDADHFRRLRKSFKAAFFKRTGRGL
jgi:methylphosphotriester-DNA--protein-cysteine methyltransferase